MKNPLQLILLVSLVAIGVLLIYLEVQASDYPCISAEFYCTSQCGANFSIDYCYQVGQHIVCWFWCTIEYPGVPKPGCGWSIPLHAQCVDP